MNTGGGEIPESSVPVFTGRCRFESYRCPPIMSIKEKLMKWLTGEQDYPEDPARIKVRLRLQDGRTEAKEFVSRKKGDGSHYPASEQLADYFRRWEKEPITWADDKLARYVDFDVIELLN